MSATLLKKFWKKANFDKYSGLTFDNENLLIARMRFITLTLTVVLTAKNTNSLPIFVLFYLHHHLVERDKHSFLVQMRFKTNSEFNALDC